MHDVRAVDEVHGKKHIIEDGDHVVFGKGELWHRWEDLLQIGLHVLLDNEKVAEILLIGWGDEVIELGGILVSGHLGHLAEDLHLSDDLFALIDGSEDVFQ